MKDFEYTLESNRFLAAWGLLSLVENMLGILSAVRFRQAMHMAQHDLPIILELVIEERLFEASGVDGSKAAIYTVDAHFIWAQANNGTKSAVCLVYGLHLDTSVPNPQDPQR